MYTPPAFRIENLDGLHRLMREAKLSTLVTATQDGLMATALPLYLVESEGEFGTLYGHLARANPQWKVAASGEALVIFNGPDAYISPSWYAAKAEHGKVVPTWNYAAVHAHGPAEFFEDEARLRQAVARLTDIHEAPRSQPWALSDAPEPYVSAQLRGIVGLRIPITRLEGKCKMSQNRSQADRQGVAKGLSESASEQDRLVAAMIPTTAG